MSYVLIDVREPDEFSQGHVEKAMNVPLSKLMSGTASLHDLPKDSKIVVYCRSGSRAGVAMQILSRHGFSDVTNGINQQQVEATYNQ